jgi:hypothetical protein
MHYLCAWSGRNVVNVHSEVEAAAAESAAAAVAGTAHGQQQHWLSVRPHSHSAVCLATPSAAMHQCLYRQQWIT